MFNTKGKLKAKEFILAFKSFFSFIVNETVIFTHIIMQDNTETSLFNDCDKGSCLIKHFSLIQIKINHRIRSPYYFPDNLNGSKLHEHDSGIENSSNYSNSTATNLMGKNTESPSTLNRTMSNADKYEAKKSIFILIGIFSISLAAMFYVYMMFPKLDE